MHSNRRPLAIALFLVSTALLAADARAQSEGLKIGLVNVQRVMTDSQTARTAMQELEAFGRQKEAELEARSTEIQDLQRRLATGAASLSREETARLERELEQKTIDGQRLQDDANRELKRRQERTAEQIEGRVMPMIETLGKEMGFHMILRKFESGLLYADESLDITDELIQRLDGAS